MIKLGDKVRDRISGVIGTVVSRTENINGCIQLGVTPKIEKGKTEILTWNIDEAHLESMGKKVKVKKLRTGGATIKFNINRPI